MKLRPETTLRRVFISAACILLGLLAYSRASAAPSCDAIAKATQQGYHALWQYQSQPSTEEQLNAALQQTAKTFADIGFDLHAQPPDCGDKTKLPYAMLPAYWFEEQTKIEGPSARLLSAMTQQLRVLRQALPANNLFFAQFVHDVAAAYNQTREQLPPDVAAWATDPHLPVNAECRMPYYQDATIKTWVAPPYPVAARAAGVESAMTAIRITVDPNGIVSSAGVLFSSGNVDIDNASLDAARATVLYPKTLYCNGVSGTYVLRIVFGPEGPATAVLLRVPR